MRKEPEGFRTYCHFGTGNYHPITARIYTDISFFTCDPALGRDAAKAFNYMTGYARPAGLEKLALSPDGIRETLIRLIDEEIEPRQGRPQRPDLGQDELARRRADDRQALRGVDAPA